MTHFPKVSPPSFLPPYPTREARFAPGDTVRVRPGDAPGDLLGDHAGHMLDPLDTF